ncbi:MAG: hypothetical protein NT013_27730 [Planctomycetia bacterium]|nr:hypothetical protein [Planctomycetia bacterium]
MEWKRSLIESTTSWRQRIQLISSFVPFDGDSLLLTGSFDHCFYHELEVRFEAVSYSGLPVNGFISPRFSIATDAERKLHGHLDIGVNDVLFKIQNHSESADVPAYFVVAERVSIIEGTVFYYSRNHLKPGERIAEWVTKETRQTKAQ